MRNFRSDAHRFDDEEDPDHDTYDSISIGGRSLPEHRYADDTVLLSWLLSTSGEARWRRSMATHF